MKFINELLLRLFSDKPWFFKVVQILSVVTALITGLPVWLAESGVVLPDAWQALSSQVVSVAAAVAAFIAQLTVTGEFKVKEGLKD